MDLKDYFTIIAAVTGPVLAVGLSYWYGNRAMKYQSRLRVLNILISQPQRPPLRTEFVDALNCVEVEFYKDRRVIDSYKRYKDLLFAKPWDQARVEISRINLIAEMAKSLGYKKVSPTDFALNYEPEQLRRDYDYETELRGQLLKAIQEYNLYGLRFVVENPVNVEASPAQVGVQPEQKAIQSA
jgi:hypothetical protein